jgi:2-succinyl-5-enolpyruvyl-6-hydroxy-3-cyclohexene-1-carboxylate synthase
MAAAINDQLQKHVILDERSAGFTALGIGKSTNVPAVLICTSGTALANYYPAVIEARKSGIPMLLCTADRPPRLRSTGANQTANQLNVFGDYPVFFHEVGEAVMEGEDLARLKMLGRQAVTVSKEQRGPVHLNFPFRKPLEPDPDFLKEVAEENSRIKTPETSQTYTSIRLRGEIIRAISNAEKPVVIVGPKAPMDDTDSISNIANRLACPVLSETMIDTPNVIRGYEGFLRDESLLRKLEPDLILRFGFQPTSKSLEWGLRKWKPAHHYHFASTNSWQDATFSEAEYIPWKGKMIEIENLPSFTDNNWLNQWKKTETDFHSYAQKTILEQSALTDGSIYHYLTPQIDDGFIAVSNSFPARDIHLFGRHSSKIPLFLNRGVSGIDGITSTAFGLSIGLQKAGVLFTGDLAFLHDANALLNHKFIHHPLTIVLINNSGGSIFRMLPIAQYEEYFRPYFETPQSANIETLVSSYGLPYQRIDSLAELQKVDLRSWQEKNPEASVIECQTNADASMKLRKKFWDFEQ